MEISPLRTNKGLKISGSVMISPSVFLDDRGFFMETWNQEKFNSYIGDKISLLGWKPRFSFEEALSLTVEWYVENISWVKYNQRFIKQ